MQGCDWSLDQEYRCGRGPNNDRAVIVAVIVCVGAAMFSWRLFIPLIALINDCYTYWNVLHRLCTMERM